MRQHFKIKRCTTPSYKTRRKRIINQSIEINSLSDFVKRISSELESACHTISEKSEYTFFYRGQAKSSWSILPSLFREDRLYRDEDKIINTVFSRCPTDFSDDKTQFEKLVRMQHFGFPTRLLDITLNPLVALFFACQNLEQEDGAVYMQYVKDSSIKFFNDQKVSKKSNISRLSSSGKDMLTSRIETFKERLRDIENSDDGTTYISYYAKDPETGEEEDYPEQVDEDLLLKQFQSEITVKMINKFIMQENHFGNDITPNDLINGLVVRPSLRNERIKAQQGLFFLFGLDKESKIFDNTSAKKIIIPAKSKPLLKKELDIFGINSMTLFPDFPGMGQYIEEYFRRTI